MSRKKKFAGDKKHGQSLLFRAEQPLKMWGVRIMPQFVETQHLTYMTLLWSLINVWVAFHAPANLTWLWVINAMIVLQYLTDLWDGELGRQRNAGLIKWGFYMDHFLDYLFLCSMVFAGYMISPAGLELWYFGLLVLTGSLMVNSFLAFAATNRFQISYYGIGPTESRLLFIAINTYIIYFGTQHFDILVPGAFILTAIALFLNTYQIQKMLWNEDKAALRQS